MISVISNRDHLSKADRAVAKNDHDLSELKIDYSDLLTAMLALRPTVASFPARMLEHLSKRMYARWERHQDLSDRQIWSGLIRYLCQKAVTGTEMLEYQDSSEESDFAGYDLSSESSDDDNLDQLDLSEQTDYPDATDLGLKALAHLAGLIAPDHQLLRDLIYYGDEDTHGCLIYQMASQGDLNRIKAWVAASKSLPDLWRSSFWKQIIQGALKGGHLEMFQELLDRAIKTFGYHRDEQVRKVNLVWYAIRFSNWPAVKAANRFLLHAGYPTIYRFTREQLRYIIQLGNPKIWRVAIKYDCNEMPETTPVEMVGQYCTSLDKMFTSRSKTLRKPPRKIPAIALRKISDENDVIQKRALAFLTKHLNHDLSRSQAILQTLPECHSLTSDALRTCYQKERYVAMKALLDHLGTPCVEIMRLLSGIIDINEDDWTTSELTAQMMDELEIDLAEQDCFLLRYSRGWTNQMRSGMAEHYRSGPVRYFDGYVISDYPLSFGEQWRPVLATIEHPNGDCDCTDNPSEDERKSRQPIFAFSETPKRAPRTRKDNYFWAESDIMDLSARGWYVYGEVMDDEDACQWLIQCSPDLDLSEYWPENLAAYIDAIPPRSKTKSARTASGKSAQK
jgi:hypothetical protein